MKPQRPLIITIIFLITTFICSAQTKETAIADIKILFHQINNDSSLKKVNLENENFLNPMPDNGCELTGYFKGDTIYKMNIWIGLSYCIKKYEYYFKNNAPVFIYETEDDYTANEKTSTLDISKIVRAFEGRYYLSKGEIIDVKIKGKKKMDNSPTKKNIAELLSDSRSYTKLLRTHLKKK